LNLSELRKAPQRTVHSPSDSLEVHRRQFIGFLAPKNHSTSFKQCLNFR
jgi:hypothetical protein